ncbi:MAG: hypothetical protein V7603_3874 [Micromonosporaceae bacterium]
MDTLEWGTVERPAGSGRWRRQVPRWLGPPLAVWLAGAGVALAVAAEVLPWAGLARSVNVTGGLSVDNLNTVSVLGYYLCWIGLLGLTGLVLTGRPAVRRAAAGAALGVGGALLMVLAGIIRSIFAGNGLADPTAPTVSAGDSSASTSPDLGPGLFCACAAAGLVLAAVVVGVRRRGPLLGLAATEPVAAPADVPADLTVKPVPAGDVPADLTVQPMTPVDERLFTRPETS